MSEDNGGGPTKESAIVNADGTLVENWNQQAPEGYEELREDKTLPRIKNVWDIGKSYIHVRKQVPLEKIPRPTDQFTDADWNEWHDAGGRPKTPEDYAIARPEDFPEELWEADRVNDWQTFFHRIGLSKKQVDAIIERNNTETLEGLNSSEQFKELDLKNKERALRQKWGLAYEQNLHLGDIALAKGAKGDEEFKQRLSEKINQDPELRELVSNLGSLFAEHKIVEDTQIPTINDMEQKINEEMMKPAYLDRNHPDHDRQVALVLELRREKNRVEQKVAG